MKIEGPLRPYSKQERDYLTSEVLKGSLVGVQIADKVRRFCSFHRGQLSKVVLSRFGSDSNLMSHWMFDILCLGHSKFSQSNEVRIDAAYLSALLFLVDVTPSLSGQRCHINTLLESLSRDLKSKLLTSCGAKEDHQLWCYEKWRAEASLVGRTVIFCPNPYSLYTSVILHLCMMLRIRVVGVVVRKFTFNRVVFELKRDGVSRLVIKVVRKLIFRSDENPNHSTFSLKSLHDKIVGSSPHVIRTCDQHKIPIFKVDEFADAKEWLRKKDPDVGLFTGGGMVPKSILETFKVGVLNLHMGILPEFKGMDVVQAPILEAKPVGLTAHLMEVELDAGPVIQSFEMSTRGYDSLGSLRNSMSAIIPVMAIDSLLGLVSKRLSLRHQASVGRQYYIMHPLLMKVVDDVLSFQYENAPLPGNKLIDQNITKLLNHIEFNGGF